MLTAPSLVNLSPSLPYPRISLPHALPSLTPLTRLTPLLPPHSSHSLSPPQIFCVGGCVVIAFFLEGTKNPNFPYIWRKAPAAAGAGDPPATKRGMHKRNISQEDLVVEDLDQDRRGSFGKIDLGNSTDSTGSTGSTGSTPGQSTDMVVADALQVEIEVSEAPTEAPAEAPAEAKDDAERAESMESASSTAATGGGAARLLRYQRGTYTFQICRFSYCLCAGILGGQVNAAYYCCVLLCTTVYYCVACGRGWRRRGCRMVGCGGARLLWVCFSRWRLPWRRLLFLMV